MTASRSDRQLAQPRWSSASTRRRSPPRPCWWTPPTGSVVASGTARHPDGTAVDPRAWLSAFDEATAGLLERADAVAVGGQQHGMVALDDAGTPVFDALLWNDTRSAGAARDLIDEMGGPAACADAVGSVLVASFTSTKLRWLRDHEPDAAHRVRRVLLPHDYVSAPHQRRRTVHRPQRRLRHRLLLHPRGPVAARSGRAGTRARRRPPPDRDVARGGRHDRIAAWSWAQAWATTPAPPSDWTCSPATSWSRSARRASPRRSARCRSSDPTGSVTGFADATGRYPAAGGHDQRGTHPVAPGHAARGGPRRAGTSGPRRSPGRQRSDGSAVLRRRTHAESARRHRHVDGPDHLDEPRGRRAGRRRGAAVLPR